MQIDANSSSKALPWLYHENVMTAICNVLLKSNMPKSEFCRLIFSTQGSRFSQNSHRHRLQNSWMLLGPSSVGAKPKPKKIELPKRDVKLEPFISAARERADHSGLVETASYHLQLTNTARSEKGNSSRVGASRR
jgi:hypothetical protein